MIVKERFTPASMWPYARFELLLGAVAGAAAWLVIEVADTSVVTLPLPVATVLGTAVSILLAVRVNTAYQRWWDSSTAIAQIGGLSRTLVRAAVAITDSKDDVDPAAVTAFQHDVARRQVAYLTALTAMLRTPTGYVEQTRALSLLDTAERRALGDADHLPTLLLLGQSRRIFRAYADGLMVGLDNFQLEVALAGMSQQQALLERTRQQPVPAVYAIFSRYLVHLLVVVFPFAVVGTLPNHRWTVIPAALVVAFAFRMLERIGTVIAQPFDGTPQDLPLTAIVTDGERDLLELVGVPDRPSRVEPANGYLN